MADNISITPGSGTIIRTDELSGGIHEQVVKLALGADGVEDNLVDAGQQLMAASVPVAIASDQSALPATDQGAGWTTAANYTASADATGTIDLTAAPASGQKIVITDILFSTDTAMAFTLVEETSGTALAKFYAPANTIAQITPRGKWKLSAADKKLRGTASAAGNVAVTVLYYSEA